MTDFGALNSAAKYPSIPTYHALDPASGKLLPEVTQFTGPVILTEKVDGASGRIIVMPDGDYFIGSREELLYARGDRIANPALSIVLTLKPVAEQILRLEKSGLGTPGVEVFFLEVYGHRIGGGWKQYGSGPGTGARLFDVAWVPMMVLDLPRETVASWRDRGGQRWADERALQHTALETGIELTPRLDRVNAGDLPVSVEDTPAFLTRNLPGTRVALDDTALGAAEGIVLRSEDRTVIAKARFADYDRTLRAAGKRRK